MLLLPTAYFPPLSYFRLLTQDDKICIEHHEFFIKQTFRSRCEIAGANGKLKLVVPVVGKKSKIKIKDIRISYNARWQQVHWRSIFSAYNSSPYFEYYSDNFAKLFSGKEEFLVDLNLSIMELLCSLLKLKVNFSNTDSYSDPSGEANDMRSIFDLKFPTDQFPRYHQVFETKNGFIPNLSILDLLFNQGPESVGYLIR